MLYDTNILYRNCFYEYINDIKLFFESLKCIIIYLFCNIVTSQV